MECPNEIWKIRFTVIRASFLRSNFFCRHGLNIDHLCLVRINTNVILALHSSTVTSCLSRVYQSLGNLIRWSDQVMLEGVDLDDKETVQTVTSIIKTVLDGVKVNQSSPHYFRSPQAHAHIPKLQLCCCCVFLQELVRLVIEKQQHPSPTSPTAKKVPSVISAQRYKYIFYIF